MLISGRSLDAEKYAQKVPEELESGFQSYCTIVFPHLGILADSGCVGSCRA